MMILLQNFLPNMDAVDDEEFEIIEEEDVDEVQHEDYEELDLDESDEEYLGNGEVEIGNEQHVGDDGEEEEDGTDTVHSIHGEGDSGSDLEIEADSSETEDQGTTDYATTKPPSLSIGEDMIGCIKFHPQTNVICVGGYTGCIYLGTYSLEKSEVTDKLSFHRNACRNIHFSDDGDRMFSISKDKSIKVTDFNKRTLAESFDNAHECGITAIQLLNNNVFATGDEEGCLKIWDIRKKQKPTFGKTVVDDYISSLTSDQEGKYLTCTSLDGDLIALDLRKNTVVSHFEAEYDLTSSTSFLNNSKLVCTSAIGVLVIFKWGSFLAPSETFNICHKNKKKMYMNEIIQVMDNVGAVSWENGTVTAVKLYPHENLGIIGKMSGSVEGMSLSNDGNYLATSEFEGAVKFWNIAFLQKNILPSHRQRLIDCETNLPSSETQNPEDFFSGLA